MITCYFLFKAFLDVPGAEHKIMMSSLNNWHSRVLRVLYIVIVIGLCFGGYYAATHNSFKPEYGNPIDSENFDFI